MIYTVFLENSRKTVYEAVFVCQVKKLIHGFQIYIYRCLPRPNRRKSICKHFKIPSEFSSSSSSSSNWTSVVLSTESSSPLQITIWRSFDGNNEASSDTSVVNEDPSEVLVKLKKPTVDCRLLLGTFEPSVSFESNPGASATGSIGKSGVISRLVVGLKEGLILADDFVRSGYERDVDKDVLELSPVGE